MPMATVSDRFDGKRICSDEPFDLEPNAKLIVTILPNQESDNDRRNWWHLSGQRLEADYTENEPEYPSDLTQRDKSKL